MKNLLISIWLTCIGLMIVCGQTTMNGYEYWFNNDYSAKTTHTVIPGSSLSLNSVVQTAGLPDGLHVFSIRFVDNMKRYSLPFSQFFMKMTYSSPTNTTITSCEYWFDNDYALKTTIPANGQQLFSLNTILNTSNLNQGLHVFSIRFRDSSLKWSSTYSQFFYKKPESFNIAPEISGYEYWFDNDDSSKIYTIASNQEIFSLDTIISVSSLNKGLHIMNIRFLDKSGHWSSILSHFFVKQADGTIFSKQVKSLEYWFDNDYTNKVILPITNQQGFLIDTLISTSGLTKGIHILTVRFEDNSGLWSLPLSQFFYKSDNQIVSLGSNKIVSYRYWIDDDFSAIQQLNVIPPDPHFRLLDSIDFRHIQKGMHSISFQFSDSTGLWSTIITDSIEKLSLPVADFSYVSDFQCDSTTVTFVDNSIDGDIYNWDFGNGKTDTSKNPVVVYFQPGIYAVSLTVTDTLLLTDSTVTKHIEISGNTAYTFNDMACATYTSPSGNYTWTISGIYNDTIPNSIGCDSLLTIDLIIHPVYHSEQNVNICNGDVFHWNGLDYSVEGSYFLFQQTQQGCDSILALNLTVHELPDVTLSIPMDFCCVYTSPLVLTGNPSGGNFSGQGVTGNMFDPAAAGPGIWQIVYSYTDQNGCTSEDTSFIEVDECLGINSMEKSDIYIFPNPAGDQFFVRFPENGIYFVTLCSMAGYEVMKQESSGLKIISLNVGSLPAGIYILKASNKENVFHHRLIIER